MFSSSLIPIRIISVDYNSETWLPIEGSEYLSKGNFADKGRSYKKIFFSKNKNIIGKKPLNSKKTNTYTVSYKTIGSNNIMTKDFEIILTESTNLQDKFQINNFKKVSNPNIKYFNLNKDTLSFREDNITVKEDIIIPKVKT